MANVGDTVAKVTDAAKQAVEKAVDATKEVSSKAIKAGKQKASHLQTRPRTWEVRR